MHLRKKKKKINLNVLSKKREEKIATFPKGNNCFSCKSTSYIFIIMKFPCFARDIVQTRRMFDWVFREDEKKKGEKIFLVSIWLKGREEKKIIGPGCSTATFLVICYSTATYIYIFIFSCLFVCLFFHMFFFWFIPLFFF